MSKTPRRTSAAAGRSKSAPKSGAKPKSRPTKRAVKRPAKGPVEVSTNEAPNGVAGALPADGRSTRGTDAAAVERFATETARLLSDDKCQDVVVLDIRGLSQVTDFVIIATGTSDRQMRSVLDHVQELGEKSGFGAFRRSVDGRSTWVLIDFVDVIVHLFEPNTRAHYDLEMLWGDAKRPEWERPGQLTRNRAGLTADDQLEPR